MLLSVIEFLQFHSFVSDCSKGMVYRKSHFYNNNNNDDDDKNNNNIYNSFILLTHTWNVEVSQALINQQVYNKKI